MPKLTIDDLDLHGRRVLIRLDLNVPIEGGKVQDDRRIVESLPTIRKVLGDGGRPILLSHLGRPKGKKDPKCSLAPVARRLEELLAGPRVLKAGDCCGREAAEAVLGLKSGEVLVLENLRFHPAEEVNDAEFARELASLGDVFVNDAFGTSHRAHASVVGVAQFVKAAAGYLLAKELRILTPLVSGEVARPFLAVLGGAKVSDKVGVLENLLDRLDALAIGGAMAYTFLRARGVPTGASRVEEDRVDVARSILEKARAAGKSVLLPVDHGVSRAIDDEAGARTVEGPIPDGLMGLDIGPKTRERFAREASGARTIVWNGPMGVYERKAFADGTAAVARALADAAGRGATVVVGGGESADAAERFEVASRLTHVSTGGGAFLELLEGKELPGLAALTDK